MKRKTSLIAKIVSVLILLFLVFYFWASSSSLSEADYAKVLKNKYSTEKKNDSVFSIVTYNLGYLSGMTNNRAVEKTKDLFDNNLKKVLDEFKKINTDIIALQEVDYDANRSYHVNQEEEIAKLGYNYTARGVNWDKKYVPFPYWPMSYHFGKVISGQSVLSKFPIKSYERIVLDRVEDSPFYREAFYLNRLLQIVKLEIENKEVVIINAHLEAFDKKTREKHTQKAIDTFTKYAKTNPTILLGDFNSDPEFKNAAITKVIELPNVGCAAFSPENHEKTFSSENPTERLDYIFYTEKTITYVKGKVLNQLGESSDHLPVEMKFMLK